MPSNATANLIKDLAVGLKSPPALTNEPAAET